MSEQTIQRREEQPSTIALTRRVLNRAFWRYVMAFEISWNYERMQALGFCWAMIPVLRHLNPDDNKFAAAMQRHLVFFNTSKVVGGPLILGTTIAMEEAGSATSADGVKVAMMGPMAGIGDTITFALYNSIIFSIGANWAIEGKVIGPIFTAVLVLIPYLVVRRWQFNLGYKEGKNLVTRLSTGALTKVNEGATILGMVVLGGFIPSIVKMVTTLTYKQNITTTTATGGKHVVTQAVPIQTQLDTVLPYLLPVAVTAFVYWLLRKFNLNPIWAIVVVFVIGLGLGWFGWFAKALPGATS
ncbi:MAG TPA: PTS system mannose/fructose/sorbose family transporter subunit IID [Pseudonocardiaceae bacterium]|jgi:mannose/fructose/N-acetylgalactosamine-specific phosphotransferase system component IID|nr:PTS system mannose/fructose/sorbose family transporter subunit IID [Pseudonocardiaceae bacterium]